jgi:hypothetical protein
MNIAIEYVLRNGRIQDLLMLPCSLFLEKKDHKLIITIHDRKRDIAVRHWNLDKPTDFMPAFDERNIPSSEVFVNPDVIVADYKLLEFVEEPYVNLGKQHPDLPQAAIQEKDYWDCLDNFFQPKAMYKVREDWLWESFNKIHVTKRIRDAYDSPKPSAQREFVKHYSKSAWKIWDFWKKNLLNFSGPSPELVFAQAYDSKFLKLEVKEEPSSSRIEWADPIGRNYFQFVGSSR